MFELAERRNIIATINQSDQAAAIILDQRFIKRHSIDRTIKELAAHHYTIATRRTFRRWQQRALLLAYELIPSEQVKLVKD